MTPHPPTPTSDLVWDAWRYASDELTASEREVFESRLASDVEACEALAEAVLLRQALLARGSASRAVSRDAATPAGRRSAGWFVTLVAASLLVLVGTTVSRRPLPLAANRGSAAVTDAAVVGGEQTPVAGDDEDLVDLWVALNQELKFDASADSGLDDVADAFAPESDDVPDWMFAALEDSSVDPVEEDAL